MRFKASSIIYLILLKQILLSCIPIYYSRQNESARLLIQICNLRMRFWTFPKNVLDSRQSLQRPMREGSHISMFLINKSINFLNNNSQPPNRNKSSFTHIRVFAIEPSSMQMYLLKMQGKSSLQNYTTNPRNNSLNYSKLSGFKYSKLTKKTTILCKRTP